jgi:hypothetical protein
MTPERDQTRVGRSNLLVVVVVVVVLLLSMGW